LSNKMSAPGRFPQQGSFFPCYFYCLMIQCYLDKNGRELTTLLETFDIAAYCRISVDLELDRDNTSIENQRAIIEDYVQRHFPESNLTFYEDRDRSGYTFEQRESYQQLRPKLLDGSYDILIVKDLSRFSRRNGRGLAEFEDLIDAGMRIIAIGDDIDYPARDDRTKIQLYFFINEMPVTETSKKVRNVIRRRQEDGKWICAVPYGYVITNSKTGAFSVEPAAAQVVRKIFELYNTGWGYKRIANYLTGLHIPTPRMDERARAEARGDACKLAAKPYWSIATVEGVLRNDFYIGTLRQGKYTRKKINGGDIKRDISDHIVFENHHEPVIDYRTFAVTQEQLKKRTTSSYRGVKKYDNVYSGFLACGDCGEPMFAISRPDGPAAYKCSSYHKRGLAGCTSHHIRTELLDRLLKSYLARVREHSAGMLEQLEANLRDEEAEVSSNETLVAGLERQLDEALEELKATKRQKIRDLMKRPGDEDLLEQTYAELEADCEDRIKGLQNQIALTADRRNTVIRVNRVARTAIDIFDEIIDKDKLDKQDLELIIEKVLVFEDHLEIRLNRDIDALLNSGALALDEATEAVPANFSLDTVDSASDGLTAVTQSSRNHGDKVYRVNVVSDGDPLEIFVDREGEIILKKYSPIGELSAFAREYADAINETLEKPVLIADRDSIIAVSGAPKKDFLGKAIGRLVEKSMAERRVLINQTDGEQNGSIIADEQGEPGLNFGGELSMPIIAGGDPIGAVIICSPDNLGDVERKVAQSAAGVLARQMEN